MAETPQSRYDKTHTTQFKVKLNLVSDADIIEWISKQTNKQGAVKELIRSAIAAEK